MVEKCRIIFLDAAVPIFVEEYMKR